MLSLERWKSGLSCVCVERCKPGRRVQTWQKGANLAEPDRRVQTWQKGANLAEGCKPGRRVQTWQKGAEGAESGYPPCTFAPFATLRPADGQAGGGVRPRPSCKMAISRDGRPAQERRIARP